MYKKIFIQANLSLFLLVILVASPSSYADYVFICKKTTTDAIKNKDMWLFPASFRLTSKTLKKEKNSWSVKNFGSGISDDMWSTTWLGDLTATALNRKRFTVDPDTDLEEVTVSASNSDGSKRRAAEYACRSIEDVQSAAITDVKKIPKSTLSDQELCEQATTIINRSKKSFNAKQNNLRWTTLNTRKRFVEEAIGRGLDCGVDESESINISNQQPSFESIDGNGLISKNTAPSNSNNERVVEKSKESKNDPLIEARAAALAEAEAEARKKAEALVRAEAEAKARAEKLALVELETRKKAQAFARAEAEARDRAEALAKAEAEAKLRTEALAKAELEARRSERARIDALARAEAEAEELARARAESFAQAEAAAKERVAKLVKAEAEAKKAAASAEAEAKKKAEALAKAQALAEQQAFVAIKPVDDPKEAIEEIDLKITLYARIANHLPQTEAGYKIQQDVLDEKIEELRIVREALATSYLSTYKTPIYPININLGTTAFRYSEIFPSIPYYIPGTKEVGEFLVQPVVSDTGQLTYEFTFLDPSAKYNREREQIVVINSDMGSLIDGLEKIREWTETTRKQKIRRRYEKVASCFPKSDCGERQVGKSSTEVVFQIYEDGSTSGKLQRVKGEFLSGYNMSVESTVLLGAYLKYMRDIGEQEFKIGSMSDQDLDAMFK